MLLSSWEKTVTGKAHQRSFHHNEEKAFKKQLVEVGSTVGVDKVVMQGEYEQAQEDNTDIDKKVVKLGELNEISYEDLILYFPVYLLILTYVLIAKTVSSPSTSFILPP